MADRLLSGFRALDLTDEKGFVCGKILATLGVEVIKVERPGGDPARMIPPFAGNRPDPEKSLYWLAFNTDKKSITLNIETDQGQDLFRRLVEKADFVLESFQPGYLDKLGLGYEALNQVNPRIIMTSITPFGQKGPYAHYKGSELIASAMGGVLLTTGDPDRPPVREGPDSIYFHAGAAGALGTIIAHFYREISGQGQQVDISLEEVVASRMSTNLVIWEFDKRLLKRTGNIRMLGTRTFQWIWQCKDGYVHWQYVHGRAGAPANRALSKWIDEEGLENPLRSVADWDKFDLAAMTREELDAHRQAIARLFAKYTKKQLLEQGLERGIDITPVSSVADVFSNYHLAAQDFWANVEHPELDTVLKYPKFLFLSSETQNFVTRQAPRVGQDNEDIYTKHLGLSHNEIAELKRTGII